MRNRFGHHTYIWQRPDWPEFRWDSERLLQPLAELSRQMGELQGRMSMLGFEDRDKTHLEALTAELVNSSEIEGLWLNPESVRSSIARRLGIEEDGMMAEDHYVEGLVNVMMDAIKNAEAPLTSERIFDWHAALFPTGRSGGVRITVAGWRTGPEAMQVVSGAMGHEKVHYEAPPSESVPKEMSRLLQWADESIDNPVIKAAVAHLWMVTVHPFDDGNGRLSRTLADMMLARGERGGRRYFSMSAEINRRKKSYYDILEKTQKGNLDITEWLLWFCDCLSSAVVHTMEVLESTLRKGLYWERHRDCEINERQRKVINRLWDGFEGKLTTSKWAKICHCSQDTALRDITDLVAKGMLLPSSAGGRSRSYRLPE